MRLVHLALAVIAVGCGTKSGQKEPNNAAQPVQTEQKSKSATGADQATPSRETQTSALPQLTVIRVPVDASGVEQNDQAEMRLVHESSSLASDEAAAQTFDSAAAPARLTDELDSDSSTDSWHNWRGGGNGGWNGGWNGGGNNGGWGGWNCYRPVYCGWGGNNWSWNYNRCYTWGGYNYYSYNQGW